MPCIWLGHIGEYRLCPSRLGANTTFPRRPAASGDQDGIGPQSLRTQTVFPNMSSPDAWYSSIAMQLKMAIFAETSSKNSKAGLLLVQRCLGILLRCFQCFLQILALVAIEMCTTNSLIVMICFAMQCN